MQTEQFEETNEIEVLERFRKFYDQFHLELEKKVFGQKEVIDFVLIAILAKGHALLVGVPGVAKTLMVSSIAQTLDLKFNRIQFTPDLMPSDITGTDILNREAEKVEFMFNKGPVFGNVILADEINRAPAKTQAALLEAMQEKTVTTLGTTYALEEPFFVLATQNPIEQEGTYNLPEAQLDRFMFQLDVGYPSQEEELAIAMKTTGEESESLQVLSSREEILAYQSFVRKIPVPDHLYETAVKLVRATRPDDESASDWVKENIEWGAGPRAIQALILAAKAHCVIKGTYMVSLEDLLTVAKPILRHRVVMSYQAALGKESIDEVIEKIIEGV